MSGILVCSHVCLYEKPSKLRETEMIGDSLAFKSCFCCISLWHLALFATVCSFSFKVANEVIDNIRLQVRYTDT